MIRLVTILLLYFISLWLILLQMTQCDPLSQLIHQISSSSKNSIVSNSRIQSVKKLKSLLEIYTIEHSKHSLLQRPHEICDRKFVWTKLICSHAGNRLQEFLAEFAWSIIYNRTFLVEFDPSTCYGAIYLQDWVVQLNDASINNLAISKGCPIIDPRNESTKPLQMRSKNVPFHCCDYKNITKRVILFGGPSANIVNFIQESSIPHQSTIFMRNRSDIIFNTSRDSGAFMGYLAEYIFNFTDEVKSLSNQAFGNIMKSKSKISKGDSKQQLGPLLIGLHIRHQKLGEEDELDSNAEKCLKIIRSRMPSSQRCVILLASDRLDTLVRIPAYSKRIKCHVKFIPRTMKLNNTWGNFGKDVPFSEQGPWRNSFTSMADYYFLSHSHLMIGTEQSTFSQLMASWSAARSVQRGKVGNNFILIHRKDSRCTINEPRPRTSRCPSDKIYQYNTSINLCSDN